MEPCTRKRTMPKIVTDKSKKRACPNVKVAVPLPTSDAQDGDVEFGPLCGWHDALEREIEQRMKTMPSIIPERALVIDPSVAIRMKHKGKVAGDIEVLERESDEETVVDDPRQIETLIIESDDDFENEDDIDTELEDVDVETVENEEIIEIDLDSDNRPAPFNYQPTPIQVFAPSRPIMESRGYQAQHRAHCAEERRIPAESRVTPFWASEVIPEIPDYFCVKVNEPECPKKAASERKKRIDFGLFPTEWIPEGSPYWQEFIDLLKHVRGNAEYEARASSYDGVLVTITLYSSGKIKASRNHVSVIIRRKYRDPTPVPGVHGAETEKLPGVYPTEFIPVDSPYYAELVREVFFPRDRYRWIHVKGRDGQDVHFRLGESLRVHRNGVTVDLM
ncbi:hypothetical protein ACFFRR_005689 [Megaselia abdita]